MNIRSFLGKVGNSGQSQGDLPTYSSLPTHESSVTSGTCFNDNASAKASTMPRLRYMTPFPLSRFLSDFTLGFADGLTVPFALTAGLSSLGRTETVISAGMAEICAGCISMGIGGYLACKDDGAREEGDGSTASGTCSPAVTERESIDRYLEPLNLPPDLLQSIKFHVAQQPEAFSPPRLLRSPAPNGTDDEKQDPLSPSPTFIGLSIALGYLLGGLLPLSPYFFVGDVVAGLRWSFLICILALFSFGFAKSFVLLGAGDGKAWQEGSYNTADRMSQRARIRRSAWAGVRMVILGGFAAVAAVLCVRAFDGIVS
ncbi:DUF125-domain-containing protein [Xylariomycetidae sp. FL2044]|nr:DUF125-domain-containing protein [Xylariomycetidae sp. FL2044]